MQAFTGNKDDDLEGELKRIPASMRASAYLDQRDRQILQSQQVIGRLQGAIHDVMMDIARVLAAVPSAGNQAMLDRSLGDLKGLANAVGQTSAANGDGGGTKSANVDLTGINAAIEARANSLSRNGTLGDAGDKTKVHAAQAKTLLAPDVVTEPNEKAPGDTKPTATIAPASNMDRAKLALAKSHDQADPVAEANSDLPALPNKRPSRPNAAALKLDHAEAVAKSDAPDGQGSAKGVEQTAKASSAPAKAEAVVAVAARKPPSPPMC